MHLSKTCVKIFVFVAFILSKVFSEKYEQITKCRFDSYFSDHIQLESFEFICEPNKIAKEYFDSGEVINCERGLTTGYYSLHQQNLYVIGEPGQSFYKDRRHEISFRDCNLKQLPVIFNLYKAIRKLNVSSTGLRALRSRNFEHAENLTSLIASHNQLTEIPSCMFADSKKINDVNFAFNKINRIDPMAFETENNLTSLNFSNNLIHEIQNPTFVELHRLEILDLSYNVIANIQSGLFDELRNLRELYLSNNLLKKLQCSILANMLNLELLILTKNNLEEFNSTCVQNEKAFALYIDRNLLRNLTLSQNMIEIHASANKIERIFIENGLENMTLFDLSENRVERVPDMLQRMSSRLKYLDVSDSIIGKLNVSTFSKFDNLEHLSLRNTNLSNIQYGTFPHQQLRFLDLSNNNLVNINFGMMLYFKLQSLYLDGNMLQNLNNLTHLNFPALQYLSVDNNNFDCEYLSEILQMLRRDKVFIVSNPKMRSVIRNAVTLDTHLNGIACYHNSILSELEIIEIVNNTERNEISKSYNRNDSNADAKSLMWKVEFLLICISVLLACLLVVYVAKNLYPAMKIKLLAQTNVTEQVQYRSNVEDQLLIF